jgi:hypothetical protein
LFFSDTPFLNCRQGINMKKNCIVLSVLLLVQSLLAQLPLDSYNVVWNTPSRDASGSMPLGNGDIGLNVWVERNGDILFLIGKSDAFDENASLNKLGRVRITLDPNPFARDSSFSQTLKLRSSEIEIKAGKCYTLNIWVDANHPVIHIESTGHIPFIQTTVLESWRSQKTRMTETQVSDLFKNLSGPDPYPTWIYPDHYVQNTDDRIILYHHNIKPENDGYQINMDLQGAGEFARHNPHPLHNTVYGSIMQGDGCAAENQNTLTSARRTQAHVEIFCHTQKNSDQARWLNEMNRLIDSCRTLDLKTAKRRHEIWWNDFWERSWVHLSATDVRETRAVQDLARAYHLCRYMNAAAGRGGYPIKFNGSIFTYGKESDPDYRRWGGPGFWTQNQRLVYWPMLAQGDFDLMQPWFIFYQKALPLAVHRTKSQFNHEGAHFTETLTPWGSSVSGHYGWTPFADRKNKSDECTYVTYYWQSGIEVMLMMLTYYEYSKDPEFARTILLPHAEQVTTFYDRHYFLDNRGKIHFGPAQSLETYHIAVNPMPEIAGLYYTLTKLLTLPAGISTEPQRARWQRLLKHLPPIPVGMRAGKRSLLFAESWDMKRNIENPELYAVFPYRLYGIGKDSLHLARNAFDSRVHTEDLCWYQDAVDAALLGIEAEAKRMILARAAPATYSDSRFPAFWNAFNDWIPDVDHGGNLQLALQFMLMQCEGREIRVLPCWPKTWDVHFKFHAPCNTTVEAVYKNGRFEKLIVLPKERAKDVIVS